jgi:hypothetical protein
VLLWPVWKVGGVAGLFVWRWATTLTAFGLLWLAAKAAGARGPWAAVALVWCGLFYRYRSQVRPETLVAVLLAAQLWLLELRRARGVDRHGRDPAWALPAIALLWANAHISYYLGLALTGFYWLDAVLRRRRAEGAGTLLAALGLSVIASFVNPFGWRLLAQPFQYMFFWRHEAIYQHIPELRPIVWSAYTSGALVVWLPLVVLLALWGWWRRRRVDLAQALTLLVFLPQALSTQRFLGYAALLVAPGFARDLDEACEALSARALRAPWARAAAAAALVVLLPFPSTSLDIFRPRIGINWDSFPVRACDWIDAHGVRGRAFAPFEWGGYLLWRFWPQHDRLPFMDIHQAGTPADREAMALVWFRPENWRFLDGERHFDWALIFRTPHPGYTLIDVLDADSTLALVFADDTAALYLRREGRMAALAERERFRWVPAGTAGLNRMIQLAVTDPSAARAIRAELERQVAESPMTGTAHGLLANLDLDAHDWRGAIVQLEAARRVQPDQAGIEERERMARDSLSLGARR